MPLEIALEVEGPGREVFVVCGLPAIGPEILVAVQRLDDERYLTPHGLWDIVPSWHPCARIDATDEEGTARFAAPPSLAAGIRAAQQARMQAHLRRGDFSDLGPLVVRAPSSARDGAIHGTPRADPASQPGDVDNPMVALRPKSMSEPVLPLQDIATTLQRSQDTPRAHPSNGEGSRSDAPGSGRPLAASQTAAAVDEETSDLAWSPAPTGDPTRLPEPAIDFARVDPQSTPSGARTSRWLALAIVVAAVLAVLALGIRFLVWRSAPDAEVAQPPLPTTLPSNRVTEIPDLSSAAAPKLPPARETIQSVQPSKPPDRAPTGGSGTSGKALYLELKKQSLSPQELFDRGVQADRAGDCEAAIRLMIEAAKRTPGLAEQLARRYDPQGFTSTPCFPQAKPDSAIVWYQNAAEQDVPAAQRRYGELLLGEAASGPVYQEAVDWLRKAASAGEEGAERGLRALGER